MKKKKTKLQGIIRLKYNIKLKKLDYESKLDRNFNLSKYALLILNELKRIDEGVKLVKKRYFLNNIELFLSARERVFNNFKGRIFGIKDKIPT